VIDSELSHEQSPDEIIIDQQINNESFWNAMSLYPSRSNDFDRPVAYFIILIAVFLTAHSCRIRQHISCGASSSAFTCHRGSKHTPRRISSPTTPPFSFSMLNAVLIRKNARRRFVQRSKNSRDNAYMRCRDTDQGPAAYQTL
jgi:hypothetical protein